jgi:hypothetical protein
LVASAEGDAIQARDIAARRGLIFAAAGDVRFLFLWMNPGRDLLALSTAGISVAGHGRSLSFDTGWKWRGTVDGVEHVDGS